jgi:hypothetical protein
VPVASGPANDAAVNMRKISFYGPTSMEKILSFSNFIVPISTFNINQKLILYLYVGIDVHATYSLKII